MADLLTQLEQEFGLSELVTKSITLYGHKWTLRKLDYGDVDKSNQMIFKAGSETMQSAEGEFEPAVVSFRTSLAFVALAIAAVDDQPACFLFKVTTKEELGSFNPLDPPKTIRHKAADKLYTFLSSIKKRMDVVSALFEFYTAEIDVAEEDKKAAEEKSGALEGTAETNPLPESSLGPTASVASPTSAT